MTPEEQIRWWIENETADNVIAQIIADRKRIAELEAKLDRVRKLPHEWRNLWASGINTVGILACADELQSAMGDEDG